MLEIIERENFALEDEVDVVSGHKVRVVAALRLCTFENSEVIVRMSFVSAFGAILTRFGGIQRRRSWDVLKEFG